MTDGFELEIQDELEFAELTEQELAAISAGELYGANYAIIQSLLFNTPGYCERNVYNCR
jgi:hypothetical protein